MGDTVEALGYKADVGARVKDSLSDRFERAKGTMTDVVGNVTGSVADLRDAAQAAAATNADTLNVKGGAQRAVSAIQENPIGLALTALALGFLAGSLVPVSDVERRRLQPIGLRLANQAKAATNDAIEAGKAVVSETVQGAVASALGSAQTHAADVVDAAKARAAAN
jgi:uncharacterized protein YjbJ (UPF0337 family)